MGSSVELQEYLKHGYIILFINYYVKYLCCLKLSACLIIVCQHELVVAYSLSPICHLVTNRADHSVALSTSSAQTLCLKSICPIICFLPELSLSFLFCHLSTFPVFLPFSSFLLLSSFLILFLIFSKQIKNLPKYTAIHSKWKENPPSKVPNQNKKTRLSSPAVYNCNILSKF